MPASNAIERLAENMRDVKRLLEIHVELTGDERGRRRGVEVLNKSAVVLVTAAWEAFVEDLAEDAFSTLLLNAGDPHVIPSKVRALAAAEILGSEKNHANLWKLAGDGWKDVLRRYEKATIEKYVGPLNTPASKQVDDLFHALLGLQKQKLSASWHWPGQSVERVRERLRAYIKVRGQIAHRVQTDDSVTKKYARDYANFVYRLAVKCVNRVRTHLHSLVGSQPWDQTTYEELVGESSAVDASHADGRSLIC